MIKDRRNFIINIIIMMLSSVMAITYFLTTNMLALPIVWSIVAFVTFIEFIYILIKVIKNKLREGEMRETVGYAELDKKLSDRNGKSIKIFIQECEK